MWAWPDCDGVTMGAWPTRTGSDVIVGRGRRGLWEISGKILRNFSFLKFLNFLWVWPDSDDIIVGAWSIGAEVMS